MIGYIMRGVLILRYNNIMGGVQCRGLVLLLSGMGGAGDIILIK